MKVLFAAAELTPLARVGGLAEAAGGLVAELRRTGMDVDVVLPDYGTVELTGQTEYQVRVPDWVGGAWARTGEYPGVGEVTLIDVPGMARPQPYVDAQGEPWPDNDVRFFGFSAALAEIVRTRRPDVVHLNDWHTALTPAFVDRCPATVLTIHTLGYQGITDDRWLGHLRTDAYRFAWFGGTNPVAGAIQMVDRVISVSPSYASEILTPANGAGLHERLVALGDRLVGIRNGIDTAVWNPATDPLIEANYVAEDLSGRAINRKALLSEIGWRHEKLPMIGVIGRLVEQKGIDLLLDIERFLPSLGARLVVLGSGESDLAQALALAATKRPEQVFFLDGYDAGLAHRIFAGTDFIAMPSRFEPCGLAQMQAMLYGSIPIVTAVGGLRDTVIDADVDRRSGTGFVSDTVDAVGMLDAIHRAIRSTRRRSGIQSRGMTADWSWAEPARRHVAVYEAAIADRAKRR